MKGTILVAMAATAAIGLGVAAAPAGQAAPAAGTSCYAGLNKDTGGYQLSAMFVASGRPARIVRRLCGIVRTLGWNAGYQRGATKLVCGGHMRRLPGIKSSLFASPLVSAKLKPYCHSLYPSGLWVRFR